ncbi:MAG TPA: DEAD/DEAH box helicase, partial [Verrucomicrobiae bacterium]|nr:DEAD/DEAH box helicase [Verrucomicrobiae bacterium]
MQALRRRVEPGGALSLTGVSSGAQPFLAALIHKLFPDRPVVAITGGLKAQEGFQQDLETWLGLGRKESSESSGSPGATNQSLARPLFFPAWEVLPHESKLPHADVVSERLETLVALTQHAAREMSAGPAPLVVTTSIALLQKTFPAATLSSHTRQLQKGDRHEPLDLVEWLEDLGYEPEAQVTQKGDIALRGGILDIYPLTSPWPVRLEFFGDELESLRYFDPVTQVSREEILQVTLPPGGEIGILKRTVEGKGNGPGLLASLLDYLPGNTVFLLCDPDSLNVQIEKYQEQIPPGDPFHLAWEDLLADWESRKSSTIELRELDEVGAVFERAAEAEDDGVPEESSSPDGFPITITGLSAPGIPVPLPSLDAYRPLAERAADPQIAEAQRREFFAQLHRWLRQDYQVLVYCNNDGERQRFTEIWAEYGLASAPTAAPERNAPQVFSRTSATLLTTRIGSLTRGFLSDAAKLVVVTDAEIFGRYKVQRPRRLKGPHAAATRSALDIDFTELEEGDFVVHLQHGIGRYLGLQVMPLGLGRKTGGAAGRDPGSNEGQECLVIEYAPGEGDQAAPKLYVPVTEAHLVSKYVGAGKARPVLNTLGGTRWAKAKAHAEHAVRDLASELLSIQAARDSQTGHSFGEDAPWQREFESSFLYEETPDQHKAIVAAKRDMESPKPMDRLICGDVGFGKTEVAIRAAFKAVMGGKQVAILVPTTVLAQQHYNTFRERMADYPVRIDLLSRFRSRREQQKVLHDVAAGAVDIVVGTHRLVQKDVSFKDLGLVVIDEEQRFGVLHKEKFKLLRKMVDVLTLSATPIPRTLYLALTGARDMSTIETPPQDRLPVETIVTQYDERVIRDAVQRELNRGGQVFFLHNRVLTIHTMQQKLQTLVPAARIVVGHGQMHADELEDVMT